MMPSIFAVILDCAPTFCAGGILPSPPTAAVSQHHSSALAFAPEQQRVCTRLNTTRRMANGVAYVRRMTSIE
eukprot:scaffold10084_cov139-Isochrysis_galbana.AAC.12